MIPVFPQGEYDHSHAWQSTDDRVAWERTFATGTDGQRKMAQAMITANRATPADEIRAKMASYPPPAPSGLVKVSLTLNDVLGVGPDATPTPHAPTDFSGTPAGMSATSRPSLGGF
jgi:hypothetical protein